MTNTPVVSVVMITYGHENYIRQAIKGVLMQKCNFKIELILANDCSPDKTDEVIQEILKTNKNFNFIKYFKHEENLGMMPNFQFALQKAKGKYVALCEGDDYWTDIYKLQKQVDLLESNPEYVLSFHKVKVLTKQNELVNDFITKVPENYENQETLAQVGNYIHTPSVVFRNVIAAFPEEFVLSPIGDYFLYLLVTSHGKIKYLTDTMGVYRHGVGIYSSQTQLFNNYLDLKQNILLLKSFSKNVVLSKIFLNKLLNDNKLDHKYIIELVSKKSVQNNFTAKELFLMSLQKVINYCKLKINK